MSGMKSSVARSHGYHITRSVGGRPELNVSVVHFPNHLIELLVYFPLSACKQYPRIQRLRYVNEEDDEWL